MNRKIYLFTLIILFGNSLVFADPEYQIKCVPDNTMHNDILGCYISAYESVDKKLNVIYKQKIAKLKKSRKDQLQRSQSNWINERDSKCAADEASYGRESHFEAIQCQIDITNQRIDFINKFN